MAIFKSIIVLTFSLLLSVNSGYQERSSDVFIPFVDKAIEEFTADEMRDFLKYQLELRVEKNITTNVQALISFTELESSTFFVELIEKHNIHVKAYNYEVAGRWYPLPNPDDVDLREFFDKRYDAVLEFHKGVTESMQERYEALAPGEEDYTQEHIDANNELIERLIRDEALYIGGFIAVTNAETLLKMWESTPELYAIKFGKEDADIGRALYPSSDMSFWW